MLKFFRTIRKKLIEEDNVRKYLFYAIGEILLVVIGILIALQVNNWNEERKDQQQAETYVQLLIEDLNADLNKYNTDIAILSEIVDKKVALQAHFDTAAVNRDSMRETLPLLQDRVVNFDEPNTSTIQALLASGNIELLPDHVALAIRELRQLQTEIIVNEAEDLRILQNMYIEILTNVPFQIRESALFNDELVLDRLWELRSEDEQVLLVYGFFTIRLISDRRSLGRYMDVRDETVRVLSVLNTYMEN